MALLHTVEAVPGMAEDIVRDVQARRDAGTLPLARAETLIEGVTEQEAVRVAEAGPVIKAIHVRIKAIERAHDLGDDESWLRHEGPPEWRMLNRAWEAFIDATQIRILESLGEFDVAEMLADRSTDDDSYGAPPDDDVLHELLRGNGGTVSLGPRPLRADVHDDPSLGAPMPLEIDREDLLLALEEGDDSRSWFLDRESGAVTFTSDIDDIDTPEIDDHPQRWVAVERPEPREAFRHMHSFALGLPEGMERERLLAALDGPKPFRRFREALGDDRARRDAWDAYRSERLLAYAADWLEHEGIRPVWKSR
jgi:hypothetical protein